MQGHASGGIGLQQNDFLGDRGRLLCTCEADGQKQAQQDGQSQQQWLSHFISPFPLSLIIRHH
jgi:hypothetical protein